MDREANEELADQMVRSTSDARMSEKVTKTNPRWRSWVLRLVGLLLLVFLLTRLDIAQVLDILSEAKPGFVLASVLAVIPLIFIKTVRWQGLLRSQSIKFPLRPAFLAYFGSLFIGFLTPGRLGEFVKALHVSKDCGVSSAKAFSSVLGDRLFDFYALLITGGAALFAIAIDGAEALRLTALIVALASPLVLFLNDSTFGWLQRLGLKLGSLGQRLFGVESWLVEMRHGLQQAASWWLVAVILTVLAYAVYFGQCYLLALALGLKTGFVQTSYAIALGSLVTLLPVSISGLGTREATIVLYLSTLAVPEEKALAFSLLVFATFYIAGGLMGGVAWLVKPVPLTSRSTLDIHNHRKSPTKPDLDV